MEDTFIGKNLLHSDDRISETINYIDELMPLSSAHVPLNVEKVTDT